MSLPTTNLPLFQIGNQWSDKNGFLTPITAQFVQNLMARVGASSAPSNTALADAIAGSGGTTISIPVGASEEQIREMALADEGVKRHLDGVSIRKIIIVPNRILNFVVG